jgi:hypothetical protein
MLRGENRGFEARKKPKPKFRALGTQLKDVPMNTTNTTLAPRARNQGGVEAGSPGTSSSGNHVATESAPSAQAGEMPVIFDGASVPAAWLEQPQPHANQRRADHPMAASEDFTQVIAACVAEQKSRRERKPGEHALGSSLLEPRHWIWLLAAFLTGLGISAWLGLEIASAIMQLTASR